MNQLVSIIIVNWNGKSYLKHCLESLYQQDYAKIEVIVVDNSSTDNSVEYIRDNFPKVKIIRNKKNLGFAEGNNIGYQFTNGKYILFLNNDTKVTRTFLTELVDILQFNEKIGGAQSKMMLLDNPKVIDSAGSFLTTTGFLYHYGLFKRDGQQYQQCQDIYSAKGACMIFKKDVLEKVKVNGKVFDDSYFAYFEDTDLCHRVWLKGYRIVFTPKSIIYHKTGGTSAKFNNSYIQYHSFKNRINSYIKNLGTEELLKILPMHILLCEIFVFFALIKLKFQLFVSIQKAILWNLINIKVTLMKRRIIQNDIRILDDQKIFKKVKKNVKLSYYYYFLTSPGRYEE